MRDRALLDVRGLWRDVERYRASARSWRAIVAIGDADQAKYYGALARTHDAIADAYRAAALELAREFIGAELDEEPTPGNTGPAPDFDEGNECADRSSR